MEEEANCIYKNPDCPKCPKMTSPTTREWEKYAANIALTAWERKEHYAEFSETIYQGVKRVIESQLSELAEKMLGVIPERVDYITHMSSKTNYLVGSARDQALQQVRDYQLLLLEQRGIKLKDK